jgi:hypothetical protein
MNNKPIILHCGGRQVTRDELASFITPRATETHIPVAHLELLEMAETSMRQFGLEIAGETSLAINSPKQGGKEIEAAHFFGVIPLKSEGADWQIVAGLRNSHDKRFPAAITLGSRVFVCDNLAFSGEIVLARRHTKNIMRDLPRVMSDAMSRLIKRKNNDAIRFEAYRGREVTDIQAHDLICRSILTEALPKTKVREVLDEWASPRHAEFGDRTMFSLFNAFTETYKGTNAFDGTLALRTTRLQTLFDCEIGLNLN